MCQTVCISESIVSLSKRSFTRRLKIASSRMVAEKGMLARLNNQLDELYELLYDNFTSMSVSDYNQFAPQLAVLIETLKSLHRDYLHSSYKHALSDSINRLQGNISAIEEIRQDILHFKVNLLHNPRYSGIIAQAKAL